MSFGFPTLAPAWARGQEADGFSAFTATQKAAACQAIGLWDDLIATDFAETTSNPRITFQNTTTDIGYAHAYFPGSWAGAGSVWTNPAYNSGTNDLVSPSPGDWGFTAFMHEIGHALGLAHAGNYNGGNPTYATDALYRQDTVMYTIMSYFDAEETGADHIASDGQWYAPQTPMVHDILAIQALYGVETTTRTGNTVYGFHSTANRSVFDFSQNRHPIVCIWDAGGNDTLDLSGFTTASRIDLHPGAFSDADAMTKNISIAFGAWIENAVGGEASDNITGNDRANRLSGNGGNDVLIGGLGDDNLSGGAGNDRLSGGVGNDVLNGGAGRDLFFFNDAYFGADRIVGFEDGIDRLRFVHTIADSFTDFAITGNGTSQVTVSLGGQTLLLQSAAAITLSAADFIFA